MPSDLFCYWTALKIREQLGCVVQSAEVKGMVQGKDRKPELGISLANQCRQRTTYPPANKNSSINKNDNE